MDGYKELSVQSEYVKLIGPFFVRLLEGGQPETAFKVENRHTNALGVCHGGMLLSVADAAMSMEAIYAIGGKRRGKTIRLSEIKLSNAAKEGETVIARTSHKPEDIKEVRRLGVKVPVSVTLETTGGVKVLEAMSEFIMPLQDEENFELHFLFK
jgi:acyl-coenzyme A thioesterase PaaI-like protein